MRNTIEMAREAGAIHIHKQPKEFALVGNDTIKAFEALVRADAIADERDKWMERTAILIRGEREVCAKTKAGKPRELKPVGCGTLLGEQQFCFDKGWREGAASVRATIRARGETK